MTLRPEVSSPPGSVVSAMTHTHTHTHKQRERPEKTGQGQDKDNRQVGRQTDGPTATARQRGEAGEADRQAADRGRTEPDKIGWTGQTFF